MKLLFISHSGNLTYGAAKSLGLLLRTIDCEFDIVFDKNILINTAYKDIEVYVGDKCKNIYFGNLPFDYLPIKDIKIWHRNYSFFRNIKECGSLTYRQVKYHYGYKSLKKIMEEGKYDYIVLNSIILYPLIRKGFKFVLYLRELLKCNLSFYITNKINMSCGIISIDLPVQEALFSNHRVNKTIPNKVITNPFNMESVKSINPESIRQKYNIETDKLVLTMAGTFSPVKGLEFVLESFNKCNRKDAVLIIAGNGEENSSLALKRKYSSNPQIIFVGVIDHMEEIYAITDYVVRGESEFCTGRTVYEALYAGCGVMIQGYSNDIDKMDLVDNQKSKVYFYQPRDEKSFCDTLNALHRTSKTNNIYSNLTIYKNRFCSFLNNL